MYSHFLSAVVLQFLRDTLYFNRLKQHFSIKFKKRIEKSQRNFIRVNWRFV